MRIIRHGIARDGTLRHEPHLFLLWFEGGAAALQLKVLFKLRGSKTESFPFHLSGILLDAIVGKVLLPTSSGFTM